MPPHFRRRHFAFGGEAYLSFFLLSHFWLAMPQLVLQADWQEVWHSPQPPFLALSQRLRVLMVLICFMIKLPPLIMTTHKYITILPQSQHTAANIGGFS